MAGMKVGGVAGEAVEEAEEGGVVVKDLVRRSQAVGIGRRRWGAVNTSMYALTLS